MLHYQYIYLAVAVIVIIGIGVLGVLLIRRGRKAVEEEKFAAAPQEVRPEAGSALAADEPVVWNQPVGSTWGAPESETAADVESGLTGVGALLTGKPDVPAAAAQEPALPPSPSTDSALIGAAPAQPNYLEGVEQLLTEWRAKHELAASGAIPPEQADAPRDEKHPAEEVVAAEAPAEERLPETAHENAGIEPLASEDFRRVPARGFTAWRGAVATSDAMVLVDPLGAIILDMIEGQGRLGGAELKRLDVFRPERIDLAVQTFHIPARLQADEDAVLRLAQIELYAATLELRSKWSAQISHRGEGVGDAPLSARDFRLKIARDILDLPAPDRAEVIGFLLGGLLSSPGSTLELKRAVIDTLEHLRSASLANVLLDCLDDPDPIVQEYALAAADRLLED